MKWIRLIVFNFKNISFFLLRILKLLRGLEHLRVWKWMDDFIKSYSWLLHSMCPVRKSGCQFTRFRDRAGARPVFGVEIECQFQEKERPRPISSAGKEGPLYKHPQPPSFSHSDFARHSRHWQGRESSTVGRKAQLHHKEAQDFDGLSRNVGDQYEPRSLSFKNAPQRSWMPYSTESMF